MTHFEIEMTHKTKLYLYSPNTPGPELTYHATDVTTTAGRSHHTYHVAKSVERGNFSYYARGGEHGELILYRPVVLLAWYIYSS